MAKRKRMVGDMPYYKAAQKLRKLVQFMVFKRGGKNTCCQCEQSIDGPEEMTWDHTIPWRTKTREEAIRIVHDKSLIKPAHPQCNVNNSKKSSSGYRGSYLDRSKKTKIWKSKVTAGGNDYQLGHYELKEAAAMRRDLFMMEYYQGKCTLNFPQLREFYKSFKEENYEDLHNEYKVRAILAQ